MSLILLLLWSKTFLPPKRWAPGSQGGGGWRRASRAHTIDGTTRKKANSNSAKAIPLTPGKKISMQRGSPIYNYGNRKSLESKLSRPDVWLAPHSDIFFEGQVPVDRSADDSPEDRERSITKCAPERCVGNGRRGAGGGGPRKLTSDTFSTPPPPLYCPSFGVPQGPYMGGIFIACDVKYQEQFFPHRPFVPRENGVVIGAWGHRHIVTPY